ncbi:MAG TPA: 3-deoxy-D-manno-octulosonic acid transferase [Candidatus Binataceae bacterium]|nr:3-deoxy-D-manno-octulosonic acid transferase [Candidatus Binataceae bacterium]
MNNDHTAARIPFFGSAGFMTALYNMLWYPALPFALIASGGSRAANRRERLGTAVLADAQGAPRIWIHASSVGEVEAMRPVALGLMRDYPNAMVVVTTMTAAGRAAARRRIAGAAAYRLAPLDCGSSVRSFLAAVRPQFVLIAETELWPNYLIESARIGAKVAIVNGRISARSMRRYRYIRPLIAEALMHTSLVLTQTPDDARRFRTLGASPSNITVTGNTKFDLDDETPPLRSALEQFCANRTVLVAGSTAPGEERMVLTAYRNLTERFPGLALVLAPRHLSRADQIAEEIRSAGFIYDRASLLPEDGATGIASIPLPSSVNTSVLLLDTMGELRGLYPHATIAFVGGSMLPPRGGQNLTEPAAASVPVIFGPHYENQQHAGDVILESGGGRVVADAAQIESTCAEWLADDEARRAVGANALRAVERLAGGAAATLNHLSALIGTY